jgi:hypothetical protein
MMAKRLPSQPAAPAALRKRRPAPGGTIVQQFSHLLNRLAWCVLPIEEFVVVWRNATPAERRRRRPEIWRRFKAQRDDPVTRQRMKIVFDDAEIVTLLGTPRLGSLEAVLVPSTLPLQPKSQWGGPCGRAWRRAAALARAIAGIRLQSLPPVPRDLASAIAGGEAGA